MATTILKTGDDTKLLILRLALGLMILPHGAQKLLGWFGGGGFDPTVQFFTQSLGFPLVLAVLVIVIEFFGGLALLTGTLGRLAALGVGIVMAGAVFMTHLQHGFFMNWYGVQAGEGWEFHLLAVGIALALVIGGSGAFSVDRLVLNRVARS